MPKRSKSHFLDVDPSIIERNMLLKKDKSDPEEEIKKMLSFTPTAKLIKPTPGFCVKTRLKNESKKVFVNICQTDAIPAPADKTEEELCQILNSDEASDFRVPMSAGEPRMESDKSGQPVQVIDIAINPHFLKKVQESTVFQRFFLTVVFEILDDKHQLLLDEESIVILKNRKCVGNLQMQRIQNRDVEKCKEQIPRQLIQEIRSDSVAKDKCNIISNNIEYKLMREPPGGQIQYLIGEFQLDGRVNSKDLTLDVGEDRIIIESKKSLQKLDIFVPYAIIQSKLKAVFNMNSSTLTVVMAANGPADS